MKETARRTICVEKETSRFDRPGSRGESGSMASVLPGLTMASILPVCALQRNGERMGDQISVFSSRMPHPSRWHFIANMASSSLTLRAGDGAGAAAAIALAATREEGTGGSEDGAGACACVSGVAREGIGTGSGAAAGGGGGVMNADGSGGVVAGGAAAGSIAPGQSRGPFREIIPEFGVQDEHMEELGLAKADTSKLARGGVASKPRA